MRMDSKEWAEALLEKIDSKINVVAGRNRSRIPYTTDQEGHWDDRSSCKDIGWWTNGFWGGLLWQLYEYSGNELYREEAVCNEKLLDTCFLNYSMLDHDNGFRWLPTAVAHYRRDGNSVSLNRGLLAASHLAGRYNTDGGFIRAWNPFDGEEHTGWAIIDCLMNLPLLYWASDVTGDPRFRQIAVHHADKALNEFLRPDGSAVHIAVFDTATGEKLGTKGGQGYAEGSSWSRGQAWALYGFMLSYLHTGDEEYHQASKRSANYFIANVPESGLVPVDFRQPLDDSSEDSTAAAIAACGLIELAKRETGRDRNAYLAAALKLLETLADKRADFSTAQDNLINGGSVAYHSSEQDMAIIYGDYYFVEALMKLAGKEFFIW